MLFGLFRDREHWSVKMLREKTQQPEAYLKEVLGEIAFMHRSGEHNGTWELMANFKGDGVSSSYRLLFCMADLYADQRRERAYYELGQLESQDGGGR